MTKAGTRKADEQPLFGQVAKVYLAALLAIAAE